jgi:hypothetical protein
VQVTGRVHWSNRGSSSFSTNKLPLHCVEPDFTANPDGDRLSGSDRENGNRGETDAAGAVTAPESSRMLEGSAHFIPSRSLSLSLSLVSQRRTHSSQNQSPISDQLRALCRWPFSSGASSSLFPFRISFTMLHSVPECGPS